MIYTLEEFEIGLLKRGVSQQTIEEKQQFIRDWYYETDDMNLDELVDDFISHFDLEWRMKQYTITPDLTQDQKVDLLWDFMTNLFDEVEMERIDGGYSIIIEIEEEEED